MQEFRGKRIGHAFFHLQFSGLLCIIINILYFYFLFFNLFFFIITKKVGLKVKVIKKHEISVRGRYELSNSLLKAIPRASRTTQSSKT